MRSVENYKPSTPHTYMYQCVGKAGLRMCVRKRKVQTQAVWHYQRHTQGREITWPHPVQSALTLADKGIWVRLKLRKEPEDLASAETDDERGTGDTGRC
ncbi:hypothetical protein DPX16_6233 [Anabarilius grahami]|uniref:Uncharacterized protein n=1 Tax=Anabarilius grahami TaxID=495550 RepID=A0A3N0XCU2_ANAGA|nr:hypothetical protein DPX16_6233 [Anabarilius grahami]